MAKGYSEDIRRLVINKNKQGKALKEIMDELQVSESFVYSVLRNYRLTNQIATIKKKSGRKRKLSEEQLEEIRQMIVKQPDSTLEEIKESLGLEIAISTLHYIVRDSLNFRYKKNATPQRATSRRCGEEKK